ncbi:putative quinol monooxygenase [Nannocystis pusilla]|uniref:Antibiotic biosynthesis monooxygenase n=1 Tax=Nannocystis pusilla TaxID=889268 RepID=A0ABS7U4Z3_9BACT|nr:antibiotic biosynthesis monooxygenase [Nannocystis pusilla]
MARSPAILAVVTWTADRLTVDAVHAALQELAASSLAEPGCTRFEVLQQVAEPTRFVTVARWDSDAAADAHMRSAHARTALRRLGPLLAATPRFARYRGVER